MAEDRSKVYLPSGGSSKDVLWDTSQVTNVASSVLSSCGCSYSSGDIGGTLAGVDLKDVDASSALRMSLMEHYAKEGSWYEPIVDVDGIIDFKHIGSYYGGVSNSYIYYSIDTTDLDPGPEISVEIHGKKGMPERYIGDWKSLLTGNGEGNSPNAQGYQIWDTSPMLTGCTLSQYKQYATITFTDPHLTDNPATNAGHLFNEGSSVWEKILGWSYILDPGLPSDTLDCVAITVNESNASVPIFLGGESASADISSEAHTEDTGPSIGSPIRRKYFAGLNTADANCFEGAGTYIRCGENSIELVLPENLRFETRRGVKIDNFQGISKVFILGHKLDWCEALVKKSAVDPRTGEVDITDKKNWGVWLIMSDLEPRIYTLRSGEEYAVAYDGETGKVCIQFADNSSVISPITWGKGTEYNIFPLCEFAKQGTQLKGKGTILPIADNMGYLIRQLWVEAKFSMPNITVYDPQGNAHNIAQNITYEAAPIILNDVPAPVIINGTSIDLSSYVVDDDPTTVQTIEDSAYNRALQSLDGTQMLTLSMTTLTEDECVSLCNNLQHLANDNRGLNITHTCDPRATPVLGGTIGDGIVNAINYSYTDQGYYNISVTEGPMFINNTSAVSGDAYTLRADTLNFPARVVSANNGTGCVYDVLVDGVGTRTAINGTSSILKVGDQVSVTIYNNPTEAKGK